jgi:hypothetical protein
MSRCITYQSGGFTNYGISYRKYSQEELEERKTMWVKGKPEKSGNYKVRYHGNEGRDDYTTSDGGHWWNTGSLADQGEVEYDPDSFREL